MGGTAGRSSLLGDHFGGFSFEGNGLLQILLFLQFGCLVWALRKQRHLLF